MSRRPRVVALLLAGGEGHRSGGRKQFRRTRGRSLLQFALDGLWAVREIGGVVVVVPADRVVEVSEELGAESDRRWLRVVAGGRTRHLSARAGLAELPSSCELVLVHDAARPFASPALVRRTLKAAARHGAAVPAVEVHDSTVEVESTGRVKRYLPRPSLRAVQTPQAFRREVLEQAFARTRRHDHTDDATVVRAAGSTVMVVEGDAANVKLTTAEQVRAALRALGRGGPEES